VAVNEQPLTPIEIEDDGQRAFPIEFQWPDVESRNSRDESSRSVFLLLVCSAHPMLFRRMTMLYD